MRSCFGGRDKERIQNGHVSTGSPSLTVHKIRIEPHRYPRRTEPDEPSPVDACKDTVDRPVVSTSVRDVIGKFERCRAEGLDAGNSSDSETAEARRAAPFLAAACKFEVEADRHAYHLPPNAHERVESTSSPHASSAFIKRRSAFESPRDERPRSESKAEESSILLSKLDIGTSLASTSPMGASPLDDHWGRSPVSVMPAQDVDQMRLSGSVRSAAMKFEETDWDTQLKAKKLVDTAFSRKSPSRA